jgi:hypothetical protein
MSASKEDLWSEALPTEEVEIRPGVTVTVRGMSRLELMTVGKPGGDPMDTEAQMLAWCMVEPKLTKSEAGRWQGATLPNEIVRVTDKIRDLSGIKPNADREVAKSVRGEPEPGV